MRKSDKVGSAKHGATLSAREALLASSGFTFSGEPIGGGEPAANRPTWKSDEIQFYGEPVSNDYVLGDD